MSIGVNKWRNKDMLDEKKGYNVNLTVHAEVDALSRVQDANGAVIYIARVGKAGDRRFSRPCDRCAKALQEAGVKQIIYTVG
jgi:deoxycytidylate deaminase